MLKEIAIADAYGAGFEFSSNEKIAQFNNLTCYCNHELYGSRGKYTDDTQMSIAIAELIISEPIWNENLIASRFIECVQRDPRKGYSKGFHDILSSSSNGEALIKKIKNTSERNGAAMRSSPLGFIRDKHELISKATMQASITHNSSIAIKSSCAVALAAHFGLHLGGEISDLEKFLASESYSGWNLTWDKEVSMAAYDTVSAAFSCLVSCNSLTDLLIKCVSLGGDTDSVASISIGLATCFEEYDKAIPDNLLYDLDEHEFGIEYLEALDRNLLRLINQP